MGINVLETGKTYTVKDHPFKQVPSNTFTGAFTLEDNGQTAVFTSENGGRFLFDATDLGQAIDLGMVTIIDPETDAMKTAQLNARLPNRTHELLDLICEMTGYTKTQALVNAIERYYGDYIRRSGE